MSLLLATVKTTVTASQAAAFEHIVPIDLTFIFKWRYAFKSRSILAVPVLWLITNVLWHNYMHKALQRSKAQVEDAI